MAEAVKVSPEQTLGAGSLGTQLDQLDSLIGRLGLVGKTNTLAILELMDQIDRQLGEYEEQGVAVKAEESQFEASGAALRKEASRLLREIGGAAALKDEREKRGTPESAWWWYIDDYLAQKRSAAVKRGLRSGLVLVIVAAVLAVLYQLFLAPDPQTVARYTALNDGQNLAGEGKYDEALAQVQKGLAAVPDDPELLILEGVIYNLQGKQEQASSTLALARSKLQNDEMFYLAQAQDYLAANQAKLAQQNAQAVILINPNSARGYYMLGSAQEIGGDNSAAYDSYNKAVQLGEAAGDTTISVQAKIKLGYLMQGAGALPIGTTGTATP